jgi:hypothetical protein
MEGRPTIRLGTPPTMAQRGGLLGFVLGWLRMQALDNLPIRDLRVPYPTASRTYKSCTRPQDVRSLLPLLLAGQI